MLYVFKHIFRWQRGVEWMDAAPEAVRSGHFAVIVFGHDSFLKMILSWPWLFFDNLILLFVFCSCCSLSSYMLHITKKHSSGQSSGGLKTAAAILVASAKTLPVSRPLRVPLRVPLLLSYWKYM
jgi:hypothetical protein